MSFLKQRRKRFLNRAFGSVSGILITITIVAFVAASGYGYGANIVYLFKALTSVGFENAEVWLRAIGVFFAPLGVFMGYV